MQEIPSTGGFSLLGFLWRNKTIVIFLIFILPIIISSIFYAIETSNPSYPFIKTGVSIIDADRVLGKEINSFSADPSQILGSKASIGYYFNLAKFIWNILGLIAFIFIPFILFYYYFKYKYPIESGKNIIRCLIAGFIFIFIVNILITSYELMSGKLILSSQGEMYKDIFEIIKVNIPFHGLLSFIIYLASLFK